MRSVIIGGGAAGYTAARELRRLDAQGEITLVGTEIPYVRPMLSKAPLRGFGVKELQPRSRYEEENIQLILGQEAVSLDREARQITLSDGRKLNYDRCILATGAEAFRPPIPGANRAMVVRKLADVEKIRLLRLRAASAAVIGGGVIGLEIAWELKKSGLPVTVLELEPKLMQRQLDGESSEILRKIAENQGIQVETGVKIREITENTVTLEDGREIPGDLVILSCGVRANIGLARQAGLKVNRGILVDETMQTSDPAIFACGDCTEFQGGNAGLWSQALAQGTVAARNAAGIEEIYQKEPPELLFHGFGTALYAAGRTGDTDDVRIRENAGEPGFAVNQRVSPDFTRERLVYEDGNLVGAVLFGDLRSLPRLRKALGLRR